MSTEQAKPLQLADALDIGGSATRMQQIESAEEIRRLYVENELLKKERTELFVTLRTALRHAREAMPAYERDHFDKGHFGPTWMFAVRDTLKRFPE